MSASGSRGLPNVCTGSKLREKLREARAEIRQLKLQIKANEQIRLETVEKKLLVSIADSGVDDAFEVSFAEHLHLSKPRLDFHLQQLVDAGYAVVAFSDPSLGPNFSITQKGREFLVKNNLI